MEAWAFESPSALQNKMKGNNMKYMRKADEVMDKIEEIMERVKSSTMPQEQKMLLRQTEALMWVLNSDDQKEL